MADAATRLHNKDFSINIIICMIIYYDLIKRATALILNRHIVGHRVRVVLTFARDIFTG